MCAWQALHVLDMLKSTGARPDTIMYTNLITGAPPHGALQRNLCLLKAARTGAWRCCADSAVPEPLSRCCALASCDAACCPATCCRAPHLSGRGAPDAPPPAFARRSMRGGGRRGCGVPAVRRDARGRRAHGGQGLLRAHQRVQPGGPGRGRRRGAAAGQPRPDPPGFHGVSKRTLPSASSLVNCLLWPVDNGMPSCYLAISMQHSILIMCASSLLAPTTCKLDASAQPVHQSYAYRSLVFAWCAVSGAAGAHRQRYGWHASHVHQAVHNQSRTRHSLWPAT